MHNYDAELSLDVTLRRGSYCTRERRYQILEWIKQAVARLSRESIRFSHGVIRAIRYPR